MTTENTSSMSIGRMLLSGARWTRQKL